MTLRLALAATLSLFAVASVPASGSSLPAGSDATAIATRAASVATPHAEPLGWPISHATVTSTFGYRADPFGLGGERHPGLDLAGRYGAPVYASSDGVVMQAGMTHGYGEMIAIDHGNGLITRYAHLSQILTFSGAHVLRGERIGLVGSTGRSTGPHLHYEVRVNGAAIDPLAELNGDRFVFAASDDLAIPVFVSAFAAARTGDPDRRVPVLPAGWDAGTPSR